jgi:hypothetical protein
MHDRVCSSLHHNDVISVSKTMHELLEQALHIVSLEPFDCTDTGSPHVQLIYVLMLLYEGTASMPNKLCHRGAASFLGASRTRGLSANPMPPKCAFCGDCIPQRPKACMLTSYRRSCGINTAIEGCVLAWLARKANSPSFIASARISGVLALSYAHP